MTDSNRSPPKANGLRSSEWRNAPREDMEFYNVNLSVHKYLYPRYSLQRTQDADKQRGIKYRRCTIAHTGEEILKSDRWNYNLNTSITKWKKPSVHNLAVYKNSPLHLKKPSPMKSKLEKMRLSVNESINKSKALRKEIDKNLRTTSYDMFKEKKNYARNENLSSKIQKEKILKPTKASLTTSLRVKDQIDNAEYARQLDMKLSKETKLPNNLERTLYTSTQGNVLNYSLINVNSTNNMSGKGNGYDISKNCSNSTVFDEKELERRVAHDNRSPLKRTREAALKRRHSTNLVGSIEALSQSDLLHMDRKRFKTAALNQSDTHYVNAARRHSDLVGRNHLNHPSNSYIEEAYRRDIVEQNMNRQMKPSVPNESHHINSVPYTATEYKYGAQYKSRTDNYKASPYTNREKKPNYFFTREFYEDLIGCVNDRKMIEVICNLRDDDKQVISKTMYKKIQELSANKELTTPAYFYFLYRHIGDVVDDKEYKKQQAQERSHYGYLDTPYTIAKEIMDVQSCACSDDIDDTDEYEEVELQILENHYYMKNRKELLHPLLARDPMVPSDSSLLRSNKVCKISDLPQEKKNEYLQIVQDMQKKREEAFSKSIMDHPDESRILDDAITLNEGFLISHNLFNIHFAPTFGPVVYLLKAQDDKYVYRALEVSSEYVKKIKKIVETRVADYKKNKNQMTRKDMTKCTLLTCSDVRRVLRVPMSDGWEHYGYFRNQYNVLFFRRPIGSDNRNCK